MFENVTTMDIVPQEPETVEAALDMLFPPDEEIKEIDSELADDQNSEKSDATPTEISS